VNRLKEARRRRSDVCKAGVEREDKMFAVIRTGGKQYRVAAEQTLRISRVAGNPGDSVTFSDVLTHGGDSPKVGAPLISDASVLAEIVEQGRGPKVIAFKKRRRQNSRRKRGHRQDFTLVRVTEILTDGATAKAAPKAKRASSAAQPGAKAQSAEAAQAQTQPSTAAAEAEGAKAVRKTRARKPAKKTEAGPQGSAE
jgi:large subunit ribosomal protein L21